MLSISKGAKNSRITVSLPKSFINKLDDIEIETGKKRSKIIRDAIDELTEDDLKNFFEIELGDDWKLISFFSKPEIDEKIATILLKHKEIRTVGDLVRYALYVYFKRHNIV